MTIRDFLEGHDYADIVCPRHNTVVRKLTVDGENVTIDALTDTVTVPLDTEITYEPWMFDRGSLLFTAPGFGANAKLCTEFDTVVFKDGTEKPATVSVGN